MGRRPRPHRGAASRRRHHDLHAGLDIGRAAQPRRARCRRRRAPTPRRSATRSRASCRDCSASSTSTPTRCRAASTSCSRTSSPPRGPRAATSTSPRSSGRCSDPPVRKLGVFEVDTFFPPKDRTALALRLNGLLASPSFAAWTQGVPFDIDRLLTSPDGQARRGDRHDRPPLRSRAPVRHLAAAREARHVDAPSERHHRPPRAHVHGRGRGLRAADRGATVEEADPHAAQAGARVRRRPRAVDAEPGRPRLQGDLERRHLDDRAAADRAGQGAPARRDVRGVGEHRRRRDRRHDQRPRQAGVRAEASGRRPARRCSPRGGRWPTCAVRSRASRSRHSPSRPKRCRTGYRARCRHPAPRAATCPRPATTPPAADASPVAPKVADSVPVRWLDPAAPWAAQVGAVPEARTSSRRPSRA